MTEVPAACRRPIKRAAPQDQARLRSRAIAAGEVLEHRIARPVRVHFEDCTVTFVVGRIRTTAILRRPIECAAHQHQVRRRYTAIGAGEVLQHRVARTVRVHLEDDPFIRTATPRRRPIKRATRQDQARKRFRPIAAPWMKLLIAAKPDPSVLILKTIPPPAGPVVPVVP